MNWFEILKIKIATQLMNPDFPQREVKVSRGLKSHMEFIMKVVFLLFFRKKYICFLEKKYVYIYIYPIEKGNMNLAQITGAKGMHILRCGGKKDQVLCRRKLHIVLML